MKQLALFFAFAAAFTTANAQTDKTDTSMYPEAKEGYEKVIIFLPEKKKEGDLKVEISVGKNAEVDNCNNHFLMGQMKEESVQGWGYNYYQFDSKGDIAGTLMGCPDDKKVTKWVSAQSDLIRYNSKLPIVIYVPKGMTVKTRIWKADKKGFK